jgi:hypothetical protein
VGSILKINLALAISSLYLVHFSSTRWDGSARTVDGEISSPLVKYACTPVDTPLSDMNLSVIKSRRTFVIDSSTTVSSSDIRARD